MVIFNEYVLCLICILMANTNKVLCLGNITCQTAECLRTAEYLKESMNLTVDPCDDFYEYACGNWGINHPAITEFAANGVIQNRMKENTREIIEFLSKSNSNEEPEAVHKARKLFSLCKDTDKIDKNGIEGVKDIIKQIGIRLDSQDDFDLSYSIVKMNQLLTKGMFFSVGVAPDPYNQEINRIAIQRPEENALIPTLSSKLTETLTKSEYTSSVMEALCENVTTAECTLLQPDGRTDGKTLLTTLTSYMNGLATQASKTQSEIADICDVISLQSLQNLTDEIAAKWASNTLNWTRIIQMSFENATVVPRLDNPAEVKIAIETQYVKDILPFVIAVSPYEHEIGMLWTIADGLALYTGSQLRYLKENYTSDILNTTREEWCAETVSQTMGMAVSYYYAKNPAYKTAKIEVQEMLNNILDAFKEIIKTSTWMDEKSKAKALNKTDSMKTDIAFPDSIVTKEDLDEYYKGVEITDDFLESILLFVRREVLKNLNTLNTTNDLNKDRRKYAPTTVNAFYDPERNTMIIPAAILGYPIYGTGLPALNYGAVGSVLGHEITHGFDRKGRRFNYLGNLEEWWEAETLTTFKHRAECFQKAYSNYSTEFEGITIVTDSTLTLSENIADNGGFKEALLAYRRYASKTEQLTIPQFENFTQEQLLTLGFAQVWCEQPTILSATLAPMQDHSPNPIRVNGVATNSAEFSEIWNCKPGSKMNPNVEKCCLW